MHLVQGAAVAAAICATLQQQCSSERRGGDDRACSDMLPPIEQASSSCRGQGAWELAMGSGGDVAGHTETQAIESGKPSVVCQRLKFVILASGFLSRAPENRALHESDVKIDLPSLHVYVQEGGRRRDRQIPWSESHALEAWFSDRGKACYQHSRGHFMPADKVSQARYRKFLQAFL